MENHLPKAAKAELRKGLAHCGACRIKLEALRDAGLDVTSEWDRMEKAQQVAETLLRLENPGGDAR